MSRRNATTLYLGAISLTFGPVLGLFPAWCQAPTEPSSDERPCEFVDRLVDQARPGFGELDRGPLDQGDPQGSEYRAVALHAPAASECFVLRDERRSYLKCEWKYSRFITDEEIAARERGLEDQLRECLSRIRAPRRTFFDGRTFVVAHPELGQRLELHVSSGRSGRATDLALWAEFTEAGPSGSDLGAEFPVELGWQRIN